MMSRKLKSLSPLTSLLIACSILIGTMKPGEAGAETAISHADAPAIIDDLPQAYPSNLDEESKAQVLRGRYLARLGDCVACHTGDKSKPLAGGLSLQTPFGELHSTNITPDPATGIGRYTFEQFDRVMRKGVAADGHNLYPAMPYPSYAKMTPQDMRDLYAYLMKGVAPVERKNEPLGLSFPFNQRWGLAIWNWMFLDSTSFASNDANSVEWNRGAYIVQSLGHCGACHTPRGVGFQEKAMSDDGSSGKYFLSGETVEHWRALSLRNLWTPQETATMLKTGRNDHGTVSGNMVDVVQHSTQYMTQADLLAIGTYLKSLPTSDVEKPMVVANRGPIDIALAPDWATGAKTIASEPVGLYSTKGGLGYLQFCVDCHRSDGAGVTNVFPPLAGNAALQSDDASSLIHIMLTGWATPQTSAHARIMTMPAFARLSDTEITDILNFVRMAWGRPGMAPISSSAVRKMRRLLGVTVDTSKFVTPRLADMLKEPNSSQLVYGARLNLDTRRLLPRNVGNAMNCASCHLNAGTVADGSPYVGVSAAFPSYAARSGRVITLADRINGCFSRSMNGKPLPLDSAEMKAMVAYFDWMRVETRPEDKVEGRGVGKIDQTIVPDAINGKKIYVAQCALCHGINGEGVKNARGEWTYPPLWGSESFNIGAGMARTYTAAAFVKRNMPIAFHNRFPLGQGGLTEQEAVDVAEYFTHQSRPDFTGKANDWPRDKKPADARY